MANKKTSSSERFWSKVKKGPDCWEWIGGKYYNGYGQFFQNPNKITAHRYSYELHFGLIPRDLVVCHRCDNRSCVRPGHLFVGTQKDNIQDMQQKGRKVNADTRGVKNGRAKVNREEVNEIRRLRTLGLTIEQLANSFNISETQTSRIVKGESWK